MGRAACVLAAGALAAGLGVADAAAQTTTVTQTVTTPTVPPPTVPPPTVPAPPPPAPPGATIAVSLAGVHGREPAVLAGQRFRVQGTIAPFVAGQTVHVSIRKRGYVVFARDLEVAPAPSGDTGAFHLDYTSARSGTLAITLTHPQTPEQGYGTAGSRTVRALSSSVAPGERGSSVATLQLELRDLHYALAVTGQFDGATSDAVVAYRKLTGLSREVLVDSRMVRWLGEGIGGFRVRYPHHGQHVEADLTRQVLAEVLPDGQVRNIYPISSGKPSTPTVIGHFAVYLKELGINAKGMVDSNYFIGGYAIHGYADVPIYPASHGCLRVPIPDAAPIFDWLKIGNRVDVYYESGGGSHSVRGNAGP